MPWGPLGYGSQAPYQEFRLIDVHFLCHGKWFNDFHVIFPRSIKDGFKPVFDVAMFPFKRGRQVFLWESKFEWKRMLTRGEDGIGANLTRNCYKRCVNVC